MKYLIFFLFFPLFIHGQNSNKELCEQIQSAIKYLKKDKALKTKYFNFESRINNGWNYEMYFSSEYIAYRLGIKKEEVFKSEKGLVYPIYKKLENISTGSTDIKLDCIKQKRKSNVTISKLDKDNILLNITTNRVGKQGANGVAYLFFFENGKITSVYKNNWIE